jgi:hypothetical protein
MEPAWRALATELKAHNIKVAKASRLGSCVAAAVEYVTLPMSTAMLPGSAALQSAQGYHTQQHVAAA